MHLGAMAQTVRKQIAALLQGSYMPVFYMHQACLFRTWDAAAFGNTGLS